MMSVRKYFVYLFVILLVSHNISCQQSESDEGDSLGTPLQEQNLQIDQQKSLDAPETTTQSTDVQVGGAHLWQTPYDSHMVGDAQDMRYGWIYQVNNDDPNSYQGVPQALWHRKFDDHVKSFGPNLDQEIAAFNEVDSNMGFQSIETPNLAMPMPIESTAQKPIIEQEAMPDRDLSHLAIIEKARQSGASAIQKDTSDSTSAKSQSVQMGIPSTAGVIQSQQDQTLLMHGPGAPLATAWRSCGEQVALPQFTQQMQQQYYPQSEIQTEQTLQQQMPMFTQSDSQIQSFEEQQVMQDQQQRQQVMEQQLQQVMQQQQQQQVMQQQVMQQQLQQVMQQQQQRQGAEHQMQQVMQQRQQEVMQQQQQDQQQVMQNQQMFMPMQQATNLDQMNKQTLPIEQQHLMQQQSMLTPTQRTTMSGQQESQIKSFEQQQVMQQQRPMLSPTQQASEMASLDQRFVQQQPMFAPIQQQMRLNQQDTQMRSFEQQHVMQQQSPMLSPMQQSSETASLDQRFVQQQQIAAQNQQMLMPGQKFYLIDDPKLRQEPQMMTTDQQSAILQQSEMKTIDQNQQKSMEQPIAQQTMMMPGLQMGANQQSSIQQNMGFEQNVALPQQQMWMQEAPQQPTMMTEQQMQGLEQNQGSQGAFMLKTTIGGSQAANQQQMFAFNPQTAIPQQQMLAFEQNQGLKQQQQMPTLQQQEHVNLQPGQIFAVQMQPQQNTQIQADSEATVSGAAVKTLMGPMDQGKFDEMRAALSGSPDVSTLHLLKRLKSGGHGVVFAIPAVYGGYAGGYSGATYAKPVYLSPMYGASDHSGYHSDYQSLLLAQNPTATEGSSSMQTKMLEQTQTQLQATTSGSESLREIKADSSYSTSCQTLPTTPSVAEEDTMFAAASEVAPVEVGAIHGRRGCKCHSLEHYDDDDDDDPPVAAVPIEIHPDGRLDNCLSIDRLGSNRSKRGLYESLNYFQEINEAVKNVGSLDPIDLYKTMEDKTRLERYTPESKPYIEFNANQYLPIREVDLNHKVRSKAGGPNIFSSLAQQTEQSIKEAIAKVTSPREEVQILNDADGSYLQDPGQQPQIIPLDDYMKQTSAPIYEPPMRVNLQPTRTNYITGPRSYSDQSAHIGLPERPPPNIDPRRFITWHQPKELVTHPIQVILQTIESRLSECCESCKTEVLNEISEKLKPTDEHSKSITDKCSKPKTEALKRKLKFVESDENSEELEDSTEIVTFSYNKKGSSARQTLLNQENNYRTSFSKSHKKTSISRSEIHDTSRELTESTSLKNMYKNNVLPKSKNDKLAAPERTSKQVSLEDVSNENIQKLHQSAQNLVSLLNSKNLEGLIQKLSQLKEMTEAKTEMPRIVKVTESDKATSSPSETKRSKNSKGFWDPRGLLGRLLKPIEELYNQPPPTIGVAYVPVQKNRRPKSATNIRTSSSSPRYGSRNAIVGAPRSATTQRLQAALHHQPSEIRPIFETGPSLQLPLPQEQTTLPPRRTSTASNVTPTTPTTPARSPAIVGLPRKPVTTKAAPTVGAVKKQTTRCIQPNQIPSANRDEVGEAQQSEKSAAIEGCIRQCLKDV